VTVEAWVAEFARAAGTPPPDEAEIEALLALAGVAARASERRAAPLTTWMAARAGLSPADALALAERLADQVANGG
jgi:hypothetical protein